MAYRGAGHDEAEGVDRIARVRYKDDVVALGIEFDPEAPRVIAGTGAPQPRNTARYRISMGPRILHRFDEFGDDMGRGRSVGVTHAEIDDVAPGGARLGLERIDLA